MRWPQPEVRWQPFLHFERGIVARKDVAANLLLFHVKAWVVYACGVSGDARVPALLSRLFAPSAW